VSAAVAVVALMMEIQTKLVVVVEEEHLPTKHLLQLLLENLLQFLSVLLVLVVLVPSLTVLLVEHLVFLEV
jgi:hypothetical protein